MGQFTASVEEWVAREKELLLAILRQSTQEVVRLVKEPVGAGGNMPIDTSFLQQSLKPSDIQMPPIEYGESDGVPSKTNAAAVEAMIGSMELGTTLHFGFTAAYAMRQNYGFVGTDSLGRNYNQPGRHFVELAVQQWPQIVERNQRRLAAKIVFGS